MKRLETIQPLLRLRDLLLLDVQLKRLLISVRSQDADLPVRKVDKGAIGRHQAGVWHAMHLDVWYPEQFHDFTWVLGNFLEGF